MRPTAAAILRSMIPNHSQLTALAALKRHTRAGKNALAVFQNRRLRQLISHAYAHVPYYRQLFDRTGLKPRDIRTTADLPLIPMSTKRDYQARPLQDKLARGHSPEKLLFFQTSGSTGEPMKIWRTWFEERLLSAFRQRARHSFGMKVTDRVARIGRELPRNNNDNQGAIKVLKSIGMYHHSRIESNQTPVQILAELERKRPDILAGYPGTIIQVAGLLEDGCPTRLRPRFLITDSEPLPQAMRRTISAAFNAPVYDLYGSWEFNLIAWECLKTGGYHVCDDGVILEILKDGQPVKPGESGEVVCTGLHSFAMPFIRFRMGDVVTRGDETCGCGMPFSTIRNIQGRAVDYFAFPDGRLVSPMTLMAKGVSKIYGLARQVQVVQERKDHIAIHVVPASEEAKAVIRSTLTRSLPRTLGPDVGYDVTFVSEIRKDPGGKIAVVKSRVTRPDMWKNGKANGGQEDS